MARYPLFILAPPPRFSAARPDRFLVSQKVDGRSEFDISRTGSFFMGFSGNIQPGHSGKIGRPVPGHPKGCAGGKTRMDAFSPFISSALRTYIDSAELHETKKWRMAKCSEKKLT
jgi:hypothetical protein